VLAAPPALHAALVADGAGAVADGTGSRYRCGHRSNSCVKLKPPAARRSGIGSERVGVSFQDARRDDGRESHARKAPLRFVMHERA
jgi:hypothetical protein